MKTNWKRTIIVIAIVLVVCMVIGSFFDYQISQLLYHPDSKIGIFLASYGQLPAMLCCAIGGALLIRISDRKKALSWIGSIFGGVLLNVFAVMGITMDPMLYMEGMPLILSLIIAILMTILADALILKYTKNTDKRTIKRFIILIISVMFIEIILINIVKIPWGRPRMRMISVQPEASFQPWWIIGSEMKDHLMALGVAAEEFKSFPSGHTGNAACALLLGALPMVIPQLKGKEKPLLLCGIVFAAVVAISRIVMGAHFLSDVTVGFTITFIVICLMTSRLCKGKDKAS